jgi:hypothetical protein
VWYGRMLSSNIDICTFVAYKANITTLYVQEMSSHAEALPLTRKVYMDRQYIYSVAGFGDNMCCFLNSAVYTQNAFSTKNLESSRSKRAPIQRWLKP